MRYLRNCILLLVAPCTVFAQSSGTGFFISDKGYIVTCHHVIEGATDISIRGVNGDFSVQHRAEVIATDKVNDLSILKIECKIEKPISFSLKWAVADAGQEVFTLGYPLRTTMGDEIKLTNGIISSTSGFKGDVYSYQITVPVQPGNSGGPLFNKDGHVVGVINAKHSGAENAGYAVKTNVLKNLIQSATPDIVLLQGNQLYGNSLICLSASFPKITRP